MEVLETCHFWQSITPWWTVSYLMVSGGCDVDGGGGLVHVPEDCHCVCPDHHTLHCYFVSYLLG